MSYAPCAVRDDSRDELRYQIELLMRWAARALRDTGTPGFRRVTEGVALPIGEGVCLPLRSCMAVGDLAR